MSYYEIKHRKTQTNFQATAKNYTEACATHGYKPQECKLIWRTDAKNACDTNNY